MEKRYNKSYLPPSTNYPTNELNNSNFKSFNSSRLINLPSHKFGVDTIISINATINILSTNLVKTPVATTLNGSNLTGLKLFFKGCINSTVNYIADDIINSIHYDNYKLIFVESLPLIDEYSYYNKNILLPKILDISASNFNSRSIFITTLLMIEML